MAEYLQDHDTHAGGEEKDDLVKVWKQMQNDKGKLENALSQWKEKYSDVIEINEAFEIPNLLSSSPESSMNIPLADDHLLNGSFVETVPPDTCLRKRKSNNAGAVGANDSGSSTNDTNYIWHCDQYLDSGVLADDTSQYKDDYFEVMTPQKLQKEHEDETLSLQTLIERLRQAKARVSEKCEEFSDVVTGIGKAASESCSLRERVGMTHRSLTMIEMRQEKVMREALYESVTANCTIRRLHDEVIQLRIRDSQHQGDIQRLMAENNRLKLKLMEARVRTPASANKSTGNSAPVSTPVPEEEEDTIPSINCAFSSKGAGLLDIDDLSKPVCEGAIQRGSLPLYKEKPKPSRSSTSNSSSISLHENTLRNRTGICPLCNQLPDEDDCENEIETRSVGTSTADIENIVAHRRSIVVMGMVLPIPLFLACLLRTIEESMTMMGRVCFAELPPFDPSFPELQLEVMEVLNQMYLRVQRNIRQ